MNPEVKQLVQQAVNFLQTAVKRGTLKPEHVETAFAKLDRLAAAEDIAGLQRSTYQYARLAAGDVPPTSVAGRERATTRDAFNTQGTPYMPRNANPNNFGATGKEPGVANARAMGFSGLPEARTPAEPTGTGQRRTTANLPEGPQEVKTNPYTNVAWEDKEGQKHFRKVRKDARSIEDEHQDALRRRGLAQEPERRSPQQINWGQAIESAMRQGMSKEQIATALRSRGMTPEQINSLIP